MVSDSVEYRLGGGPAGRSGKNMNLFVKLNLQLSYVHMVSRQVMGDSLRVGVNNEWWGIECGSKESPSVVCTWWGGDIIDQNRAGTRIGACEPTTWNLPGRHRMGMKSSLHRWGMLTHSVCRKETGALRASGHTGFHSWDNELCVATCVLITVSWQIFMQLELKEKHTKSGAKS